MYYSNSNSACKAEKERLDAQIFALIDQCPNLSIVHDNLTAAELARLDAMTEDEVSAHIASLMAAERLEVLRILLTLTHRARA
jgi:hypothetical protein